MEVNPLPTSQPYLFSLSSSHNLHSRSFTMPSSSEHSPLQTTTPVELKRQVSPRSNPSSHPSFSVPLSNLRSSRSTQHSIPFTNSTINKPQHQTSTILPSNSQHNTSSLTSKVDGSIKKQSSYPPVSKIRSSLKKAISLKDEHRISIIYKGFRQGSLRRDAESFHLLAKYFYEIGKVSLADICENSAKNELNTNNMNMDMNRQDSYNSPLEMTSSVKKRKQGVERKSLDHNVIMSDVVNVEEHEVSSRLKSENISRINVKDEVEIVKGTSSRSGANQSQLSHSVTKQIEEEKPEVDEYPGLATSLKRKLLDPNSRFFVQLADAPKWKTFRRGNDIICQLTVYVILPSHAKSKIHNRFFAEKQSRICKNEREGERKAANRAENRAAKCMHEDLERMTRTILYSSESKLQEGLDSVIKDWRKKDEKTNHERLEVMSRIEDAVRCATIPELYKARIFMYGSMTFGLATAASDIDIAINLPDEFRTNDSDKEKRRRHLRVLRHLCDKIALMGMRDAWVVDAKIPVLRCEDDNGNDIDLTICNRHAVNMSKYIRSHLKEKTVWDVCIFIKHWAKRRQLVGVRQGYINSIGWTVMVIYFLHHVAVPRIGWLYMRNGNTVTKRKWKTDRPGKPKSTARLITEFFFHFAYIFDFEEDAISANLQKAMSIEDLTGHRASSPMFIENPCWDGENVVTHVTTRGLRTTIEEMKRAYFSCIHDADASELLSWREREENLFNR